jgi:hypothetical protein
MVGDDLLLILKWIIAVGKDNTNVTVAKSDSEVATRLIRMRGSFSPNGRRRRLPRFLERRMLKRTRAQPTMWRGLLPGKTREEDHRGDAHVILSLLLSFVNSVAIFGSRILFLP